MSTAKKEPQERPVTPPPPNSAKMQELLGMMTATLTAMGQNFDSFTEHSTRIATLGPSMDSAHEIDLLRKQMRAQDRKQDGRIADVKHLVTEVLKEQIADALKAQIDEQIATEIKLQVEEQVREQLPQHLPVSLQDQATESKQQLKDVRSSLVNTESRRANAALRASNLDDPLAQILKPNGDESQFFPKDLRTLFGYDGDRTKELLKDYGLPEGDSRERNINRFMAHAGIQFHLIPVPVDSNQSNALGVSLGSG